jgi:hypothetical protein
VVTVWEYSLGDVFLWMLWFSLFVLWIWLVLAVFTDLFRSDDLSGWSKALWTISLIVLPYLGVFIYLVVRGKKMGVHAAQDAERQEAASRSYIRSVAGSNGTAEEIERLDQLRRSGTLSDDEFQMAKVKLLAS